MMQTCDEGEQATSSRRLGKRVSGKGEPPENTGVLGVWMIRRCRKNLRVVHSHPRVAGPDMV
jgi:hypothetical protein